MIVSEMDFEPPTLEVLAGLTEEHLGLNLDDGSAMAQLAAIGLTLQAWRNTSLEDLHAGSHPSGGFPDADMMRFNIATTRLISSYVAPQRFDWARLTTSLTDPDRPLPGGLTVGALAGDEFEQLAADSQRALEIDEGIEADYGLDYLLTMLALQAGLSYKGWFGSPWWSDVVDFFVELLADAASPAWRYDDGREAEPRSVANRPALAELLLETPEALDDDSIYWCLSHGLSHQAPFGGFARWRRRRDPAWVDPSHG